MKDNKGGALGDAVALIKGVGKKLRRKEKRARIDQIRASLGLSDSQRTPMVILLFCRYCSGKEIFFPHHASLVWLLHELFFVNSQFLQNDIIISLFTCKRFPFLFYVMF